MNRFRNDINSKIIIAGIIGKEINQHLVLNKINPMVSLKRSLWIVTELMKRSLGFPYLGAFKQEKSRSAAILAFPANFKNPEARHFFTPDTDERPRYIGICLPMELSHLSIVHAIEMVSGQDQNIICSGGLNFKQLLTQPRPRVP